MIFVSGHLPDKKFPEAGQKICYDNLVSCARNNKVDLISVVNSRESKYADASLFDFCHTVNFLRLNNFRRVLNCWLNLFIPIEVAVRCDKRIVKLVNFFYMADPDSSIHIEYEQTAFILFSLPKSLRVNSTVVFHDVLSQAIERRFSNRTKLSPLYWFWRMQYGLAVSWEERLAKVVGQSIVLSSKDKELLIERGFAAEKVSVVTPKVSDVFYGVKRDSVDPNAIVFWGAMNRKENEDAVLWFIADIFPLILEIKPETKFYIVGSSPSQQVINLGSDNIVVTGFVEDPIPYFEQASIFVAPLRFGAGVKIKVLEAIAAKVPVVGTSVAAEGIECSGDLLNVANDPIQFANAVTKLL